MSSRSCSSVLVLFLYVCCILVSSPNTIFTTANPHNGLKITPSLIFDICNNAGSTNFHICHRILGPFKNQVLKEPIVTIVSGALTNVTSIAKHTLSNISKLYEETDTQAREKFLECRENYRDLNAKLELAILPAQNGNRERILLLIREAIELVNGVTKIFNHMHHVPAHVSEENENVGGILHVITAICDTIPHPRTLFKFD